MIIVTRFPAFPKPYLSVVIKLSIILYTYSHQYSHCRHNIICMRVLRLPQGGPWLPLVSFLDPCLGVGLMNFEVSKLHWMLSGFKWRWNKSNIQHLHKVEMTNDKQLTPMWRHEKFQIWQSTQWNQVSFLHWQIFDTSILCHVTIDTTHFLLRKIIIYIFI